MASEIPFDLPVIDLSNISNLKPGSNAWFNKCRDVRDALEKYSCFVVLYDRVCPKLTNEIYHTLGELFDLPTEKKISYGASRQDCSLGYVQSIDHKFETLSIQGTTNTETIEDFINFLLPSANEHFCENLNYYGKHVVELQEMITRMLFEGYGLEQYHQSYKESSGYIIRTNKYGVLQKNDQKELCLGATPHTDSSFITVLHSNQVEGLEIKTNEGNWIPVHLSQSSFAILAADEMQAWSNGRILSGFHRVMVPEKQTRYSICHFFHWSGMIEAPKELVDDEHPLLYKPFDHDGYFRFAYSKGYYDSKLKAYCGI